MLKAEKALLKERWTLMQLGFDKKRIKIRIKAIFIDIMIYSHDYDIIAITETWLSSNMYIW